MYDDNFYKENAESERKAILIIWAICALFSTFSLIGLWTVISWIWEKL